MDSEKRLMLGQVSTAGPCGLRRYSSDCEEHASHMVILIKYSSESGAGLSVPTPAAQPLSSSLRILEPSYHSVTEWLTSPFGGESDGSGIPW